jgi:hypothetical protein
MDGSATATIDTSSASRPITRETVSRMPQRRASQVVEVVEELMTGDTTCMRN